MDGDLWPRDSSGEPTLLRYGKTLAENGHGLAETRVSWATGPPILAKFLYLEYIFANTGRIDQITTSARRTMPEQPPSTAIDLDHIRAIEERSYQIIDELRRSVFSPDKQKVMRVRYSVSDAAQMVGRTSTTIREYEKDGRLPRPDVNPNGRRIGYTLEQINAMRDLFGTRPTRGPGDEPVTVAISNFKGGVGKSTICAHTAQYLALRGYRVCVIDADSQGTTTTLFGLNPDFDLNDDDTLLPYLLHGGEPTLEYAVRPTYWPGISLIPANLGLYNAEYALAARVQNDAQVFDRLREGLRTIDEQFDVLLIDPPPALGMMSISVLRAATALVIPVPAAVVDFSSTAHFFSMLVEVFETLEKRGMAPRYKFLKVLASKLNENKSAQTEIAKMMASVYGTAMLNTALKDSAEIDNASGRLETVYEQEGPLTSRDTHNRCKAYLKGVNEEIELLIRKTWPSHLDALRQDGLI